jgi:isoleucyl-tRNA synthetase
MIIKNLLKSKYRKHCSLLYSEHGTSFRLKSKSSQNGIDYSKTLNLPNAGAFELSMKNVCSNEEKIKNITDFDGLYEWQIKHLLNRPTYTLHDGPPYANGDIHIGHMVNKVLKDIYNRYKLLSGHRIDFVPGWDCHGLPIELNAIKSLKKKKQAHHGSSSNQDVTFNKNDPVDIRKNASEYAKACINLQMNSFKRMNLLADWNTIYRTFDASYMCDELDLFYSLYERKFIYRDYMPVYWSVSSQTALAEFELEYKSDHKSDAFYVAFEMINYSHQLKSYLSNFSFKRKKNP